MLDELILRTYTTYDILEITDSDNPLNSGTRFKTQIQLLTTNVCYLNEKVIGCEC